MPDWFYEQVCGYAENLDLTQRKETIGQFCGSFRGLCTQSGDMFTISPQTKETYFRKSYGCFKLAVEELAQTSYEMFSGTSDFSALSQTLDTLNGSFEDRRGIYIYLSESDELVTLARWLRTADLSKSYHIGGTISYYY